MTLPKGYNSKGLKEHTSTDQRRDDEVDKKANIDGYDQKLFERYDDKSTNFWRVLGIVIGFGLFFFILLPFIVLQEKNYEITQELIRNETAIDNLNKNISSYQKVFEKVNKMESNTTNGANTLLTYIKDLNEELGKRLAPGQSNLNTRDMVMQQRLPVQTRSNITYPECDSSLNKNKTNAENQNAWATCNIIEHIKFQFTDFNITLRSEIPMLLKNVHDSSVSGKISALSKGLDALSKNFSSIFHNQIIKMPDFWKSYEVKSDLYGVLTNALHNFWTRYGSVVGTTLENKNKTLIIEKTS